MNAEQNNAMQSIAKPIKSMQIIARKAKQAKQVMATHIAADNSKCNANNSNANNSIF